VKLLLLYNGGAMMDIFVTMVKLVLSEKLQKRVCIKQFRPILYCCHASRATGNLKLKGQDVCPFRDRYIGVPPVPIC